MRVASVRTAAGLEVASTVWVADTFFARTRGLLGRPPLQPGQGLLLWPCSGVHTFFMTSAIDVVFLDHSGVVVALAERLRPFRVTPLFREALATLELPPGEVAARGLLVGQHLIVEDGDGRPLLGPPGTGTVLKV
jgi:uncharacterized membrane protein (UPF0127 family)